MRFRMVPKSTTLDDPELTLKLNGHYALCYITQYVFQSTPKIRMKIDPYNLRQECSPEILIFSNIKFLRIFAGIRWRGDAKNESGVVENGNFSLFR